MNLLKASLKKQTTPVLSEDGARGEAAKYGCTSVKFYRLQSGRGHTTRIQPDFGPSCNLNLMMSILFSERKAASDTHAAAAAATVAVTDTLWPASPTTFSHCCQCCRLSFHFGANWQTPANLGTSPASSSSRRIFLHLDFCWFADTFNRRRGDA